MSRSDRRRTFATALGGVVAAATIIFTVWAYRHVSEYQSEQAQERQSASDDYRRKAEQRIEFCIEAIPEERSAERLECLSDTIDAAEDSAAAKHDLKAQQDMSAWALSVLYVSVAALIATVLGVIFVWLTLRETRRIGQAQLRAYIDTKANIDFLRKPDRLDITLVVKNHGQTPAYDVRVAFEWCTGTDLPGEIGPKATSSRGTLGSGAEAHSGMSTADKREPSHFLSERRCWDVVEGKLGFWVYGQITYRDAFGEDRFTKFRYRHVIYGNKANLALSSEGNEAN